MKIINLRKGVIVATGSALMGLMLAVAANAANPEQVDVEVEFVAAVVIAMTNPLQFGLLDEAMANTETVVIAPNGGVTDANNNVVGGTQAQATLNVTAAASKAITILVDNVQLPATPGYALGTWRCNYDRVGGGTDGDCGGLGMSETSGSGIKELEVGATLTGDGTAVAGVEDATFDVTITYD
jgi:hypothetical protein